MRFKRDSNKTEVAAEKPKDEETKAELETKAKVETKAEETVVKDPGKDSVIEATKEKDNAKKSSNKTEIAEETKLPVEGDMKSDDANTTKSVPRSPDSKPVPLAPKDQTATGNISTTASSGKKTVFVVSQEVISKENETKNGEEVEDDDGDYVWWCRFVDGMNIECWEMIGWIFSLADLFVWCRSLWQSYNIIYFPGAESVVKEEEAEKVEDAIKAVEDEADGDDEPEGPGKEDEKKDADPAAGPGKCRIRSVCLLIEYRRS